ncbi:hypothetical protein ACFO3A_03425 [Comamonas nitrativorans]|uniref:Uncharacterized protein n=1 Tax=Comamonas nitrativorans TaxID=108437 RepID=A0ABV9GT80_9BURK
MDIVCIFAMSGAKLQGVRTLFMEIHTKAVSGNGTAFQDLAKPLILKADKVYLFLDMESTLKQ